MIRVLVGARRKLVLDQFILLQVHGACFDALVDGKSFFSMSD